MRSDERGNAQCGRLSFRSVCTAVLDRSGPSTDQRFHAGWRHRVTASRPCVHQLFVDRTAGRGIKGIKTHCSVPWMACVFDCVFCAILDGVFALWTIWQGIDADLQRRGFASCSIAAGPVTSSERIRTLCVRVFQALASLGTVGGGFYREPCAGRPCRIGAGAIDRASARQVLLRLSACRSRVVDNLTTCWRAVIRFWLTPDCGTVLQRPL